MKVSTFVTFMLIVAGIFFVFAMMMNEGKSLYPEANINNSAWEGKYDYVNDINNTFSPLKQKFDVIQDPDAGFFTKLTNGIMAIPYAVILFPQVVFGSIQFGGEMSTGFLAALAIPGYIVLIVTVSIFVWAIFKLLEFFQRVQI